MSTEEIPSSIPAVSPPAVPKRGGEPPTGQAGAAPPTKVKLDINVVPDEVEIALQPPALEMIPESLRPMWHRVVALPGALVSLRSEHDKLQIVRLSLRSREIGWNPRWVRWVHAVRQTPRDLGGDALAAQDILSPDKTEMTLLVLPGEQRSITLEFAATLDGETLTGDYQFDVVATDTESDEVWTAPGLLRLRHQQSTLIKLLPAIYSEQPSRSDRYAPFEEKPFFERFLRGFEDTVEPTNMLLSQIAEYFDADAAPADFLPWLGTWVSLALDANWPELKRRRLIKEAVELYRWRGTKRGLSRYLEIYTDIVPEINDHPFEGMRLGTQTLLGQNTFLGDVPNHTFVVTIAVPDPKAVNAETVRSIIESEKPAHTAYALRIVERAVDEL